MCYSSADIDDLFEVQSELTDMAHKWRGLGKALGLRLPVLDKIEADRQDSESRLEQVLSQWLQQAYNTDRFGSPSWKLLVSAVAHPIGGNSPALAQQIAHRHNGKSVHVINTWYTCAGGYLSGVSVYVCMCVCLLQLQCQHHLLSK